MKHNDTYQAPPGYVSLAIFAARHERPSRLLYNYIMRARMPGKRIGTRWYVPEDATIPPVGKPRRICK